MQQRHLDRQSYFNELAHTSRDFYINYLGKFVDITSGINVLEIGCGEGGNLLPFAEIGCKVTGIDAATIRIEQAKEFFASSDLNGRFIASDFFDITPDALNCVFDVILVHDVIEHISKERKQQFISHARSFLSQTGVIFWGFPAWQMPFGGHQQICHSKICATLPYIHLLPKPIYKGILKLFGENESCINELLDIKACKTSIERFESIIKHNNCTIIDKQFWLINPHYQQKFNLKPRKLASFIGSIKYIRNFFTTSCFYITK